MPKRFIMLIIGLFFGAGGGFLLAAANDATLSGHDHAQDHGAIETSSHDHSAFLEIPSDQAAPTITAQLHDDGPGSWNLHVITTNFTFAPQNVNGAHVPGEGHAHIYIDGVKLARIYGPWFHLSDVPENAKELRVTLNANSHETLSFNNAPIEARVSLGH